MGKNSKKMKLASAKSRRASSIKKRKYDNTKRQEKSEKTQFEVLQSYIELLTERRGGDVGIDEVAARAGITQRTVFRFFKDKAALQEEVDKYLSHYLAMAYQQIEDVDVQGFADNMFKQFDKHESFTLAYIYSPFGQDSRRRLRSRLHDHLIKKITGKERKQLPLRDLQRLAVVLSLINAKVWDDLRSDFGFSGTEMSESVSWAIQLLLANYKK